MIFVDDFIQFGLNLLLIQKFVLKRVVEFLHVDKKVGKFIIKDFCDLLQTTLVEMMSFPLDDYIFLVFLNPLF